MTESTHINEYMGNAEFLNFIEYDDYYRHVFDEVYELLTKLYEPTGSLSEVYAEFKVDRPYFVISIDRSDERSGHYLEDHFSVNLPSRSCADKLAELLGGKVINSVFPEQGDKTFCLQYLSSILIKANSIAEAEMKFFEMSEKELKSRSTFVKQLFCEEVK